MSDTVSALSDAPNVKNNPSLSGKAKERVLIPRMAVDTRAEGQPAPKSRVVCSGLQPTTAIKVVSLLAWNFAHH